MAKFKDIYNYTLVNNRNTILPIVSEKEFKGLDPYKRADLIRSGYHFAVDKLRGKTVFRVLYKNNDMLNIVFRKNDPSKVEVYDVDDFGSSKCSQRYTLSIESDLRKAFKLPIIRKYSVNLVWAYFTGREITPKSVL